LSLEDRLKGHDELLSTILGLVNMIYDKLDEGSFSGHNYNC